MKKYAPLFLLATALVLSLALTGCGDSTLTPIATEDTTVTSTTTASSATEGDAQEVDDADETTTAAQVALPTITETVLVDQDGLKITALELAEDPIWGIELKLLIENNSNQNMNIQCQSLVINNYMMTDLFSASVAAGKKSNEAVTFYSSSLEAAGIETIAEIDVSFYVFDDNYMTLFDTAEIQLPTSAYGTVEQAPMDDGKELLNQNGIRIVGRYVEENSFWGAGVLLYMENNSGQDVMIQCDNMSINGYMVTPYFSSTVNNGRMSMDEISILSTDLEDNGITSIETIELTFQVIDPSTFQTILETGPITFSTAS